MCYAIPGIVEEIIGNTAVVNYFGEKRRAHNEFDNLKIGDYIYAQGGFVISIIPAREALSILATWKETFFELQETDLRLSKMDLVEKGVSKKTVKIIDKALEGIPLSYEESLCLMNIEKDDEINLLCKAANFLRQKYLKNSCCVHGIIEFSNYCPQTCGYCGISAYNKKLTRYRLTKNEIIEAAQTAVEKYGFKALVLQSGEDSYYSADDLCGIIKKIKSNADVLLFISFGEIGIPGLKKLFDAGARGLLMRFETSNPELYKKLHTGGDLTTRLNHIEEAYKMGYMIITGGLIGLPGQTNADLLNDILLTKKLHAEMYTFGPFLPHPDTPLSGVNPPSVKQILKTTALCRLNDAENAKIVVTTGFETLDKNAREKGLLAGANSVMLNVTPEKYRKDYAIYPNRAHVNEPIGEQISSTLDLLHSLGRAPTDLGINI